MGFKSAFKGLRDTFGPKLGYLQVLCLLYWRNSPLVGKCLLIHEVSRSHNDAPHSVGLLDELSARRRDLYLTTHNIHNRQTSTPSAGLEFAFSVGQRLQIHALDRAATGTGFEQDIYIGTKMSYYGLTFLLNFMEIGRLQKLK